MKVININILIIILCSISCCYTIVKDNNTIGKTSSLQSSFPTNSIIDDHLIGKWEKTFTIIDLGLGTQELYFKIDGTIFYRKFYKQHLEDYYMGEYRTISDTLLIKFDHEEEVEFLKYYIKNGQLYLNNLESPNSVYHTIESYPAHDQFIYEGR